MVWWGQSTPAEGRVFPNDDGGRKGGGSDGLGLGRPSQAPWRLRNPLRGLFAEVRWPQNAKPDASVKRTKTGFLPLPSLLQIPFLSLLGLRQRRALYHSAHQRRHQVSQHSSRGF